ncbi:hypothetical protein CAPTEDRAFT_152683 [Capitella teleta]|uniref:Prefoldin subunit 1 n=1 Tax=Capitella teleta TaxID=283909 RepID=R7VHX0_CAPTE|nr:hypothetical protein CAPTEDRAFT_152683 [Capitella teleta]|eukprot:ELU15295.1 hypothetical protein CAPTEDRAFT_152683 [Capitella teleta]
MNVDLELRKAFQELQSKMVNTQQQLKVSDVQVNQLKSQIQYTKLVQKEVDSLPADVPLYESVGRMFLQQTNDTVKENLVKKIETKQEKIKTIEGNKGYLERSLKESEDNLRELILSKQNRS